jgi:hypothetical protein
VIEHRTSPSGKIVGTLSAQYKLQSGFPAHRHAQTFSAEGVEKALRAIQRGEIGYREFCERIAAAGCVGYIVSLAGRRALYYGARTTPTSNGFRARWTGAVAARIVLSLIRHEAHGLSAALCANKAPALCESRLLS